MSPATRDELAFLLIFAGWPYVILLIALIVAFCVELWGLDDPR